MTTVTLYSVPKAPDLPREDYGPLRIRVFVADDNLVMRLGLRSILETHARVAVVGEAATDPDSLHRGRRLSPDVIVLGTGRHQLEQSLAGVAAAAAVLVVADTDESHQVQHALRLGVTSYLVHGQFTADDLVSAVLSTARREPFLSPGVLSGIVGTFRDAALPQPTVVAPPADHRLSRREAELMELIVLGRTNREIAQTLYISEKTVKNHVNHIYAKLSARNRAEVIAVWLGLRAAPDRFAA
ncbi:DNA-binding response regulator [Catellatospora citrea]|uniref:DNA-binding response regulator n=1 Tax=Catellatospora citrea TaxID=53366 RepID=A0A8J3P015_9ACTN|nr:DNA-binding response regulator [Catellatospora citrea]